MRPEDNFPGIPTPRHPGDSLGGLSDLMDYVASIVGVTKGTNRKFILAEIGCFSGQSTEVFAERVDQVIAVDSWDDKSLEGNKALTQYPMANVKACFDLRMERFGKAIWVFPEKSLDAAYQVPDESLDMVYIDADHRYEAVAADIRAWMPKIKPGGFISGHDYNEANWGPQVSRAVHELLGQPDKVFRDCSWIKRKNA